MPKFRVCFAYSYLKNTNALNLARLQGWLQTDSYRFSKYPNSYENKIANSVVKVSNFVKYITNKTYFADYPKISSVSSKLLHESVISGCKVYIPCQLFPCSIIIFLITHTNVINSTQWTVKIHAYHRKQTILVNGHCGDAPRDYMCNVTVMRHQNLLENIVKPDRLLFAHLSVMTSIWLWRNMLLF